MRAILLLFLLTACTNDRPWRVIEVRAKGEVSVIPNLKTMKRFLVFAGDCYYPDGGMNDFQEDFDTLEEARSFEAKIKEKFKSIWKDSWKDFNWTEIWDSETRTHV